MASDFNGWAAILKKKNSGIPEMLARPGPMPASDDFFAGFPNPGTLSSQPPLPGPGGRNLSEMKIEEEREFIQKLNKILSENNERVQKAQENQWSGSLLSDSEFGIADRRGEELVAPQREALRRYNDEATAIIDAPSGINFRPLLNLVDSWTGSRLGAGYEDPMNEDDRKRMRLALKSQIAKIEGEISDNKRDFIKSSIIPRVMTGNVGLIQTDSTNKKTDAGLTSKQGSGTDQRTPNFGGAKPEKIDLKGFGDRLVKDQVSDNITSLYNITALIPDLLDPKAINNPIEGYNNRIGWDNWVPDKFQSKLLNGGGLSKEALLNRSAVEGLITSLRKGDFGASLSKAEQASFAQVLGDAAGQGPTALRRAFINFANKMAQKLRVRENAQPKEAQEFTRAFKGDPADLPLSTNPIFSKKGGQKKIPTQDELDRMSEQELEEYLAQ